MKSQLRRCWNLFRNFVAALLLFGIVIVVVTFLFPKTILGGAASLWTVDQAPQKADAIFVLGGGIDFRPQAAATLWNEGYAPKILIFRAIGTGGEESVIKTRRILIDAGVSPDAIEVIEPIVSSTQEEAVAAAEMAIEQKFDTILVPTHLFHTRRVRWIFEKNLPDSTRLLVTLAPFRYFRAEDWWQNEWGLIQFPNEVVKMVFYRLRY